MKKLIAYTLFTLFLVGTVHAGLFFAGKSVNNYRQISSINIGKMGGNTSGIRKINTINIREKIFDPTEGLVGWWTFDGNATDSSGNNNDGTVNGATLTTDRNGNTDSAYSFDGVDDYIEIADDDTLDLTDEMTISFWTKTDNWEPEYYSIIQKGRPSGGWCTNADNPFHIFYHHTSNRIAFSICNGNSPYSSVSSPHPSIGIWDHHVFTMNGYTLTSYFNGGVEFQGSQNIDMEIDNYPIRIGGGLSFFNGIIDDVRIYNRALTPDEVQSLYEKY